ncbi:MAG: DUF1801 domain-containing protein [Armatimonadetes bacterium]|nr:DUF1801 domain-containing protein [Armatimonadota bacterium]MBX3109618.1 DUF1801 domain-containing protein [Fimbriimonadaceae bacterium]
MTSAAATVDDYLAEIPPDRRAAVQRLREAINSNLPAGFEEGMLYGMPSWFVPKSLYPAGYHCDPKLPLYYTAVASQNNSINFYANFAGDEELRTWFVEEFAKTGRKLDMGKSCIRFKKPEQIPFELIGQLIAQIPVKKWIAHYEAHIRK